MRESLLYKRTEFFWFHLQVLVVPLSASSLAAGGCLDRYPAPTACQIIVVLISSVIFISTRGFYLYSSAYFSYCFVNCSSSSSSHHLAEVFLVLTQQIQEGRMLAGDFSVVWGVNRAKKLPIKTHLAPLLPPEGSGSNRVGLRDL